MPEIVTPPLYLLFRATPAEVAIRLSLISDAADEFFVETPISENTGLFTCLWDGLEIDCAIANASVDLSVNVLLFTTVDPASMKTSLTLSLNDKLAGGNRVMPIWSGLLELGAFLAERLNADAAYWAPSGILSDARYFKEVVNAFGDGGAFPALLLTYFAPDSGGNILSEGLSWFCGQEIVVSHPGLTLQDAMPRVVRVVHDMAIGGPYKDEVELAGMVAGERIAVVPDTQAGMAIVRISLDMDAFSH